MKLFKKLNSRGFGHVELLIVVVVVGLVAAVGTYVLTQSHAAPKPKTGGGGTTSSVSVNESNIKLGDTVHFTSSFSKSLDASVGLETICMKGGAIVLSGRTYPYPNDPTRNANIVHIASDLMQWVNMQGGAGTCTA